jgi:hypothetical protein
MKIFTRVQIDIESGRIESEDSFEYQGELCHCGGGGGGGGDGGQAGSFGEGGEFGTSGGSYTGGSLGSGMSYSSGSGESESPGFSWDGAAKGFSLGTAIGGPGLGLAAGLAGGLFGMAEGDPASGGPGAQGGPAGGYGDPSILMVRESNPLIETKSLNPSGTPPEAKPPEAPKKKRGRTENLMTGPLGLMGDAPLERKSLTIRSLRSTLGF